MNLFCLEEDESGAKKKMAESIYFMSFNMNHELFIRKMEERFFFVKEIFKL